MDIENRFDYFGKFIFELRPTFGNDSQFIIAKKKVELEGTVMSTF